MMLSSEKYMGHLPNHLPSGFARRPPNAIPIDSRDKSRASQEIYVQGRPKMPYDEFLERMKR